MKYIIVTFLTLLNLNDSFGQTNICPNDPPNNPWLADSPWPTYHRNSYRQSSTCINGPIATDSLIIKSKINITGGTSPWMYISEPYQNGDKALYYSNATFVYKLVDNGNDIVTADSLRIDFDLLDFGWNFLLSKNRDWFTYDPKSNLSTNNTTALFKLSDADTTDVYSDIIVKDTLVFEDYGIGKVQIFALNYNGNIVFNSENNPSLGYATLGIIDQNFNVIDTLNYPCSSDEIVRHNAVAIDENNSVYVVTTKRLIKFDWDGNNLTLDWSSWYDFVNDGPTGTFAKGSGTTPTLMGWGAQDDKLVIVADGHANNNLVAFWRELPPGWTGISGMDIRFADSIPIPYAQQFSNLFQSIENSPTVHNYDVAIAQFNGFLGYNCTNEKGVQKFRWDTTLNELNLQWAINNLNMNGVLTYSSGTNLVYGTGKEADCNYFYYALDWDTGNLVFRKLLGQESGVSSNDPFYDAGNNHIIDENGDIYFPGGKSLIKLEKQNTLNVIEERHDANLFIYPNPTAGVFKIRNDEFDHSNFTIYSINGRKITSGNIETGEIDCSNLPDGIFILKVENKSEFYITKIIKNGL